MLYILGLLKIFGEDPPWYEAANVIRQGDSVGVGWLQKKEVELLKSNISKQVNSLIPTPKKDFLLPNKGVERTKTSLLSIHLDLLWKLSIVIWGKISPVIILDLW